MLQRSSKFSISKTFRFEAAHYLPHLPEGHKCRRPHGHSYQVIIELVSDALDERGFVIDYAELDFFKALIAEKYDHRDLNEVFLAFYGPSVPTTAENLARHFYHRVHEELLQNYPTVELSAVAVKETENTVAEYWEY